MIFIAKRRVWQLSLTEVSIMKQRQGEYDSKRTEYLNHIGIDVLRILNRDINEDFESACRYIDAKIKEKIG